MIMQLINYFIGSFFISVATYYVAVKLTDRKFELFNLKVIKWIFLEALLLIFTYLIIPRNFIRFIFNYMIYFFTVKKLFSEKFIKSLIISFIIFLTLLLSEIIFGIFILILLNNQIDIIITQMFGSNLGNFLISLISIFIAKFVSLFNIDKFLLEYFNDSFKLKISLLIFYLVLCLSILIYYIYFEFTPLSSMLINLFLIISYTTFIFIFLKQINNNFKLQFKYNIVLKNIENYEKSLIEQRIKNHENTNILISIKGMLHKNDKNTLNFINQILKDNMDDDKDILYITKDIPTGGLQGLIYQKLLVMKNKKIEYFIDVSNSINKDIFKCLSVGKIKDICMIIGVFIDNAIQEVESKNEKMIGIQMYKNSKNIIIEVMNNYTGYLDVQLFENKGFTTKSNGHGYGLSLVKKIIEKNNNLENIREINGNIFIQKLIIKQ